ncbi:MAG: chemotaxis protein CheW [Vicinamibacteria bacterium]
MTFTRSTLHSMEVSVPKASVSMLRCRIGGGQYLLPLTKVLEIIRFVTPTPVPQTAPWVMGVMTLRGRVIPVIDLAVKFGEPPSKPDEWTCIVLVEIELDGESTVLGLLTMLVSEIHDLQSGDLEPPPNVGTQIRVEFLRGLLKLQEGFALALDMDRVLTSNEQVAVRELATEGNG